MAARICCLVSDGEGAVDAGALEAIARACSPRVEPHGDRIVVFDASGLHAAGSIRPSGLTPALGAPLEIAAEVRRLAADRGVAVRVALAGSSTAAWILAHARPGLTVIAPGNEARALAPIPLTILTTLPDLAEVAGVMRRRRAPRTRNFRAAPGPQDAEDRARREMVSLTGVMATLDRWGLRTLGDIARLPRAELRTRFGDVGVRLHQAACGEDAAPLVPSEEVPRFVERMTLEWPIEGLEPLAFVLARVCDALCGALERADRAAVVVTTRLRLVTRTDHERRLQLPAPMRDSRVLRTLIMLDVESHPPPAGIDAVEVEVDVAPGRIVQGSLLVRALPSPETLSTLIARLGALMGETRVGAPARVDLHDGRQVALVAFAPESRRAIASLSEPARLRVLRRFRHPLAVRVAVERGLPVGVHALARAVTSGRVLVASGPWRTSGRWWTRDRTAWDRDEWDVALTDGGLYRLARDRRTDVWELEGIVD